ACVAVRELAPTADTERSVVRLRGEEAGEVAGLHVTLDTGEGAGNVRLSRRLVKRGFSIHQVVTDGHAGVVVVPSSQMPDESIGRVPVVRVRHQRGSVRVGWTEYGATGGQALHGQDQPRVIVPRAAGGQGAVC